MKLMRYHLIPVRMAITKTQKITSIGVDAEKLKTCALLVGMYNGAATMENSMEIPQKIKNIYFN